MHYLVEIQEKPVIVKEQPVPDLLDTALDIIIIVSIGEENDYGVGVACSFDLVNVEVEDELAGLDLVAFSNLRIEAVAVHGNCVDADVDQKFHAGRS